MYDFYLGGKDNYAGTGIPAAGNVHEVAQQIEPGVRVAYVYDDHCKSGCAHDCDLRNDHHGCALSCAIGRGLSEVPLG
jgi:S-adenosyl methyltransferase